MNTTTQMPALFGQEYQALRESVSELAIKKIAPFAHDVDENSRYPQEAADALQAAGFAAAHVPVEFGGQGADALAAVIIIEEVANGLGILESTEVGCLVLCLWSIDIHYSRRFGWRLKPSYLMFVFQ